MKLMVFFSTLHRNEKCEKQNVPPPSYVSVSTFPGGLATSRALAGCGTETDGALAWVVCCYPFD